jgi:hypothetical protein
MVFACDGAVLCCSWWEKRHGDRAQFSSGHATCEKSLRVDENMAMREEQRERLAV